MPREKPLLKIKVHGKFTPGRIPVPLLLRVCAEMQSAVNRQAQALEGKRTLRPGPVIANVSRECTLELFGLSRGSTDLNFAARPVEQIPLIEMQSRSLEAVSAVGNALKTITERRDDSTVLDIGVLDTLNKMGEVFEKGVDKIDWIVPQHNGSKRLIAEYTPALRTKIAARIQHPIPNVPTTVEGTLELAEGKCRIDSVVGSQLLYAFEQEKADEVYEAMHKPVKISIDPKTRKIEQIEIQKRPEESSFFATKTIDQLIAEQGVHPAADLTVLCGALPDEDVDEMVAEIYRDREV
jgi:hypothetical protein